MAIKPNQTPFPHRLVLWMELAQWWLRREGSVLVGAFGRMRMGKLIDDAARVVVTLEGIYVGEAWEGRAHYGAQWYHPHAIRRQSDGHRYAIRLQSEAIRMQSPVSR